MNAVAHVPPVMDLERERLFIALSASIVEQYSLDEDDEQSVLGVFEGWLFDLTEIADSLLAKLTELRAVERRAQRHAETHRGCRYPGCLALGAMTQRIHQLNRQSSAEFEALRRGRR